MSSQKAFASTGDIAEKKISFTEIGPDLFAFTAEGDPNTGVIVGDDCCAVFDAQATPAMARRSSRGSATVTDKPIKYVILSHYHAVRVLGASAYQAAGDHRVGGDLPAHRRARAAGLGFGIRPFSAIVPGCGKHPRPHLADAGLQRRDDAVPRQARSEAHAARRGSYLRGHRRMGPGRARHVFGRSHRVSLGLLLRRRAFARLAADLERNPRFRSRSQSRLDAATPSTGRTPCARRWR